MISSNENAELYAEMQKLNAEIACFMIVGLKESIPYVIKLFPEIKNKSAGLRDELIECLDFLYQCDFNVPEFFCDNHQSNVSKFKKLLERCK